MPLVTIALIGLTHTCFPHKWHYSFGFTLYALLIAIAILQLMILSQTRAWRWLNHPVARYIGSISYPMYLYHGFATNFARKLPHFNSDILMLIAATAATVLAGSISYYAVERPFLRLRTRIGTNPAHKRFERSF
jgi:peptidoglycan/LPS O-acetylase OafA/YrhL